MDLGIVDYHVDHSQWGSDHNSVFAITNGNRGHAALISGPHRSVCRATITGSSSYLTRTSPNQFLTNLRVSVSLRHLEYDDTRGDP
jgi:hypothetical protein